MNAPFKNAKDLCLSCAQIRRLYMSYVSVLDTRFVGVRQIDDMCRDT